MSTGTIAGDAPLPAVLGRNAARIPLGIGLSVVAAFLTIVAHPPFSIAPLVLVSYVPMIVAQHRVLPRRFAGLAMAIGIAGPVWYGISEVLPRNAIAALRILPFMLAAILIAIGYIDRWLMERTGYRYFCFAVPLVWTAISLGLAYGPTGTIGIGVNGLHRLPELLQPISIVGTLGLVLVVYLSNWAVAAVALSIAGHPAFPRRRASRIAVATAIVAAAWIGTSLSLFDDPPSPVRVAAIQPDRRSRQVGSPWTRVSF